MAPYTDKPIHGVVFDMDGTLLDTEALATQAMQATVDPFGKQMTWEIKQGFLGLRPAEWAPTLIRIFELEGKITPKEMVAKWEESMHGMISQIVKCEAAEETTALLKEMGVPQSIATSSTKEGMTAKKTNHEEMFARMQYVVTGDDPEVRNGKPAPDIYLAAARRMGLDPHKCLAFEDALSGVKAAKGAGMFVVAIPDPRLDRAPFTEAGADLILESMSQWDASAWRFETAPVSAETESSPAPEPLAKERSSAAATCEPEAVPPVE